MQMSGTSNVCRKLQLMSGGGETCVSPAGEPSGSPSPPRPRPRAGAGSPSPRQTQLVNQLGRGKVRVGKWLGAGEKEKEKNPTTKPKRPNPNQRSPGAVCGRAGAGWCGPARRGAWRPPPPPAGRGRRPRGARPEEGPGGEERGGAAAAASRGARPRLPSPLPANSPERFQGTCRAAPRLASGRGRGRRAAIPPGGGGGGGGGLPRCELSALARSWPPARGKRLSLAQSRGLRGGEPPRNAGDAGEGSGRAAKQVAGGCLRALGCLGRCLPDEQEQHLRRLERQRAGRHMVRFQHYSPQGSGASPPSYI